MDCNYLVERKGILYFRMRVPTAFRQHFPGQDIKYSLKGCDLQNARLKSTLLAKELSNLFQRAANGMVNMALLHPLAKQICANILFFDAQSQLRQFRMNVDYEHYDGIIDYLREIHREQKLKTPVTREFVQYAALRGIRIDPNDADNDALILDYYLARREAYRIQKERADGNFKNGYDEPFPDGSRSSILSPDDVSPDLPATEKFAPEEVFGMVRVPSIPDTRRTLVSHAYHPPLTEPVVPAPPQMDVPGPETPNVPVQPHLPTFREAIDEYCAEKSETWRRKNPKFEGVIRKSLYLLSDFIGNDIPVGSLRRREIRRAVTDLLAKYPVNREKKYPGMTLEEIWKRKDVEVISVNTQNHYIGYWGMFFNWCMLCGYTAINPARDQTHPRTVPKDQLRPRFTGSELEQIFRNLAALPLKPRFVSDLYPFRYWVPIFGLYQGMRLNEICQLHLENIFTVDGVPCLEVIDNEERGQKAKNLSSIRTIPIHPTLLRLGFLTYYFKIVNLHSRRKNDQLFQELSHTPGGYQRKMQWFNAKFLHTFLKDKRKTFHSFRHNFDTVLANVEPNIFLIQCLDGHARSGELGARYAVAEIPKMKETLEKVKYDFDIFSCLGKTPLDDETIAGQIVKLKKREI